MVWDADKDLIKFLSLIDSSQRNNRETVSSDAMVVVSEKQQRCITADGECRLNTYSKYEIDRDEKSKTESQHYRQHILYDISEQCITSAVSHTMSSYPDVDTSDHNQLSGNSFLTVTSVWDGVDDAAGLLAIGLIGGSATELFTPEARLLAIAKAPPPPKPHPRFHMGIGGEGSKTPI